jgi:tight adherence protein C
MFLIAAFTFFVVIAVIMIVWWAFSPKAVNIERRLSATLKPPVSVAQKDAPAAAAALQPQSVFVNIGKALPAANPKAAGRDRTMLTRAGYRTETAFLGLRGARLFFMGLLVFAGWWLAGLFDLNRSIAVLMAGVVGWYAPDLWVTTRMKTRQKLLQLALPDAMDLLVVCVEVGLGLDQALMKVAEEIEIAHPDLSEEFQIVNMEMRVGKTRGDALRDMAQRTGAEDIKALVAVLAQTDRFGTSIVQALRTFSDELRTKRRQRAEEMAAKVGVKMVPVLVFLLFPAIFLVILAPAALMIWRRLLPALK